MNKLAALAIVSSIGSGCVNSIDDGAEVDVEESWSELGLQLSFAELRDAMWPAAPDLGYVAMSNQELAMFRTLITALWRGDQRTASVELITRAAALGMELTKVMCDGAAYWLLREDVSHRRGRGVYVFRNQAPKSQPMLLQSPHVYFDIGTGTIALAAFLADTSNATQALFGNTAQRYGGADDSVETENPSDVAHNSGHPFHLATLAVLESSPVAIVQLHGFGPNGNPDVASIVSSGRTAASTTATVAIASAMSGLGFGRVIRFPEQTTALGATTNVQGIAARRLGQPFANVELSASLRETLRLSRTRSATLMPALLLASKR
jgi:hypothetical protein